MSECMTIPDNWKDFVKEYSFKDIREIYTNGSWLIPTFRVEQMMEHFVKPDWISVKDRLPKFNQKVFAVYNDTDYGDGISIRRLIIAELTVDGYWLEGVIWHPDTSITHWMPLPEPPKESDVDV